MQVIFRAQLNREPFEMLYLLEYQEKHYMAILDNPDDQWNDNQEWKEVDIWYRENGDIFWYLEKEKGNIITINK